MHEIGIIQEILTIATDAIQEKGSEIKQITINIGKISGVVCEALEFAFDVIKKDTIAKNAILKIELLPVICSCHYCQKEFQPDEWFFECPICHQLSHAIIQGKEIDIVSIEIY